MEVALLCPFGKLVCVVLLSDLALFLSACLLVHVFHASLLSVSYNCWSLLLCCYFFFLLLLKLSDDIQSFLCVFFRPSTV